MLAAQPALHSGCSGSSLMTHLLWASTSVECVGARITQQVQLRALSKSSIGIAPSHDAGHGEWSVGHESNWHMQVRLNKS